MNKNNKTAKAGFTPGPWNVEKVTHRHAVVDDARSGEWSLIAETNSRENAALIAAAPEMFSMLEYVLNNWTPPEIETGIGMFPDTDEYAKIESILKKARGES